MFDVTKEVEAPAQDIDAQGERAAYGMHVAGRRVVYLDTAVWIALSRADDQARLCRGICERAVHSKRAIFPLSYASVSELVQQRPSPSRDVRMHVMQTLSEGIAFRDLGTIRDLEIAATLPVMMGGAAAEPDVTKLFAGVGECIHDLAMEGDGDRLPDHVITQLRRENRFGSLPQLTRVADDHGSHLTSRDFFERRRERLVASIPRAADSCRGRNGKVDRNKALLQEQIAVFLDLIPAIREALLRLPSVQALQFWGIRSASRVADR
jgi:hypothetical protein